jgi:hypothetical protein
MSDLFRPRAIFVIGVQIRTRVKFKFTSRGGIVALEDLYQHLREVIKPSAFGGI